MDFAVRFRFSEDLHRKRRSPSVCDCVKIGLWRQREVSARAHKVQDRFDRSPCVHEIRKSTNKKLEHPKI
jgi:hypothetical protein